MNRDAVLIEKTLNSQSEAYAELVKKYQLPVYALALKRTRSAATAEEIAQLAFVIAYQKLHQLKDRKKFGAWLRSITIRQTSMHFRSETQNKRIMHKLELEAHAASPADPNAIPAFDQPVFGIESLISELPEKLRAAAVLCLVEGVSPRAAASVLGLKPNTLRKRLFDARARLQRQIVKRAEKELQLHFLPRDFADRCVCRCERAAQSKEKGGDNDGG
ncbi:MAG: RNA polymerase sigma factor [Deltaproteobacteria bacterium]|nr:RNA polymerase sigma factor [Deltaproteobacteria bacterium]